MARRKKEKMKYRQIPQLFAATILLLLAGCSNQTGPVLVASTPSPSTSSTVAPVVQQPLPKGLLNAKYPVMDWVFNQTCSLAVDSYSRSQMDATIAYDSAAWLYPSDGHLVEGSQDCDNNALISQARNQGLPTLLTVGVDSSWSTQDLAQYIDLASSQQQVPCTPAATTYICNIVNWAVSGGYAGVIIDFELVKRDYPDIRMKFGLFMQELQSALHQKGLLCGVTLIPKFSDNPGEDPSYNLNNFQDWKLLSRMDFLIIMVLDFDLALNKPGPITSVASIEKQLDYLWKTIPQALSKTMWELPLYGHEWQQDASGKWSKLNDDTCQQVSAQKAAQTLLPDVSTDPTTPEIAWNDQSGNRHEVWYSTNSSLVAIMRQVQGTVRGLLKDPHYKLPASFWYRGSECDNFFGASNALEQFYRGT
jgi:spore germination protein YaaH